MSPSPTAPGGREAASASQWTSTIWSQPSWAREVLHLAASPTVHWVSRWLRTAADTVWPYTSPAASPPTWTPRLRKPASRSLPRRPGEAWSRHTNERAARLLSLCLSWMGVPFVSWRAITDSASLGTVFSFLGLSLFLSCAHPRVSVHEFLLLFFYPSSALSRRNNEFRDLKGELINMLMHSWMWYVSRPVHFAALRCIYGWV
mmetsp:Transcript_1103/g.2885  ORF Transcript_1103/g.2885 Transcript_1103/m.2885 type:complete len:203 (-) Transcript_1103:122-730(-)